MNTDPDQTNGESRAYVPAVRAVAQTADQLRRVDERLMEWTQARPLEAAAAALGIGYILGRLFSRWG